jgi:hypothetical protein
MSRQLCQMMPKRPSDCGMQKKDYVFLEAVPKGL